MYEDEDCGLDPEGLMALCKKAKEAKKVAQVNPGQDEDKPDNSARVNGRGGDLDEERQRFVEASVVPFNDEKGKKNAWKLCGKMLPNCCVPRKRNKQNGKPVWRSRERVPVNSGVADGVHTKENMWAGNFDREYGEFYKKMTLNEELVAREVVVFLNFWNMYRKLIFAVTLVFFDSFRL